MIRTPLTEAVYQDPATLERREALLSALVADELGRARPVRLGIALPRDKRLRADGNAQYQQLTGRFAHYAVDTYLPVIEREPLAEDVIHADEVRPRNLEAHGPLGDG